MKFYKTLVIIVLLYMSCKEKVAKLSPDFKNLKGSWYSLDSVLLPLAGGGNGYLHDTLFFSEV